MSWKVRKWMILPLILSVAFSCAPVKQAAYFRTYNEVENIDTPDRVYYVESDYTEKIEKGDELFISVSTGNTDPNIFNQTTGTSTTGTELMSYRIDNDGKVKLPYIGLIKLDGYTLKQASDTLETVLSQYLYTPTVSMHFVNSRISILGEVNAPGVYEFTNKTINIYQAIAYANDISTFGNRKNVTIIRKEGENILKKRIDLTNDDILTSYWYNIKPNDIIYVEPLQRRMFGMETFDYGLVLSIVSTVMLVITFYNAQ